MKIFLLLALLGSSVVLAEPVQLNFTGQLQDQVGTALPGDTFTGFIQYDNSQPSNGCVCGTGESNGYSVWQENVPVEVYLDLRDGLWIQTDSAVVTMRNDRYGVSAHDQFILWTPPLPRSGRPEFFIAFWDHGEDDALQDEVLPGPDVDFSLFNVRRGNVTFAAGRHRIDTIGFDVIAASICQAGECGCIAQSQR